MDELGYGSNEPQPEPAIDGINTQPAVHSLIEAELDACYRLMLEMLPTDMLKLTKVVINLDTNESYSEITCPTDYIKMARVKLSSWENDCTKAIKEGSNKHFQQYFAFLKGTWVQPTAVEIKQETGYSLQLRPPMLDTKKHKPVATLHYVKLSNMTELDRYQVDALAWITASKVYSITGEGDLAKLCNEHLNLMINASLT